MKKVLIAVDDSKGSQSTVDAFAGLFSCARPETVVLLYVQKIEGKSLMDEMLGPAELSTLKEQLQGTVYQEELDRKARAVLDHFTKALRRAGATDIRTVVKQGHPADEVLETAKEEGAEMIVVGSRGKRLHTIMMGSVSREIANRADVPVLIAR
jgi:nucleotide-binding universal stress UspA family protein